MKRFLWGGLLFILSGGGILAQVTLQQANKEYELAAFHMAVESYREVLKGDPNNAEVLSRLADCYRHLNLMDESANFYAKALRQKKVDPVHLLYYGQVLMALGQYESAKQQFQAYAEYQPQVANQYTRNCDFALGLKGVPALYRIRPEYINTPGSDYGATFFKDKVVYSSTRDDIQRLVAKGLSNTWLGGRPSQLYVTEADENGFLKKPRWLHSDLRSEAGEGPLTYAQDGKTVIYTHQNFIEGVRQIPSSGAELNIFVAEAEIDGDWNPSRANGFQHNGSGFSNGYPSLSPDGKTLYFASNRPGGSGGWDIYLCRKTSSGWSSPENAGKYVNTPGDEITPYFDGQVLFFASNWHQGLGGFDVFRAEQDKNAWRRIFHLGNGVNSSYDDYDFVYNNDKNIGYMTSNRPGGKGLEDIYQVSRISDKIEITVLSADGRKPLADATIDLTACGDKVYSTDARGMYAFLAMGTLDCQAIIQKPGFLPYQFKLKTFGKRDNKKIEILLTREPEKYAGQVMQHQSNRGLSNVQVKAINHNTGESMEAMTDATGSYELILDAGTGYTIRLSKAGFADQSFDIQTKDGSDLTVLGIARMMDSASKLTNGKNKTPAPSDEDAMVMSAGAGAKEKTKPATGKAPEAVPVKSTPRPEPAATTAPDKQQEPQEANTATSNTHTTTGVIQKGFSLQVAALSPGASMDMTKIPMEVPGAVYLKAEDGKEKVRIGSFATREQADAAKNQCTNLGLKAFVVAENETLLNARILRAKGAGKVNTAPSKSTAGTSVDLQTPKGGVEKPASKTNTPKTPAKPTVTPPAPSKPVSIDQAVPAVVLKKNAYYVKLGVFKNPAAITKEKVKGLGTLNRVLENEKNVFFLGSYASLEAAAKAADNAVNNGFTGAYVVKEEQGKWIPAK